jgi:Na+-transporting methylmalonyl-CoA/oxaloacetate decarboxylase beta subunit
MKFKRIITLLVLGSVGIILIILSWISVMNLRAKKLAADVIGQADGPTSIIVSDGNSCIALCAAAIFVIGLTLVLLFIFRRKK